MSAQPTEQRFENLSFSAEDYAKYKTFFQYLGAGVTVFILVLIGATLFADIEPRINEIITGISGYLTNVYTEILSVIVTILILDRRAQQREEHRRISERNQRLVREIGSKNKATVLNAIREARDLDLLRGVGGILQGASLQNTNLSETSLSEANLSTTNLHGADLSDANLSFANLTNASLRSANLTHTMLWEANLSSARLVEADLSGARLPQTNLSDAILHRANLTHAQLQRANLSNANLWGANLSNANLSQANLFHASLSGANLSNTKLLDANLLSVDLQRTNLSDTDLQGANLSDTKLDEAIFTEGTLLPNGTHWTPDTDMSCFTNPQHSNFWQPYWRYNGFDTYADWHERTRPNPDDTPSDK